MDAYQLMDYVAQYGAIVIFIVVLLEYMNLPGFPAGVIMPVSGLLAARGDISFFWTIVITTAAGLIGSLILYYMGRYGGNQLLPRYYRRFPKQREMIEEKIDYLKSKGCMGVFISKLLPMIRTLISIPAGIIGMDFTKYVLSSLGGILIWNVVFVGIGYLFGEAVLTYL